MLHLKTRGSQKYIWQEISSSKTTGMGYRLQHLQWWFGKVPLTITAGISGAKDYPLARSNRTAMRCTGAGRAYTMRKN